MRIDIITLFPEMTAAALDHSIVKRAVDQGLMIINVVNLRDFALDKHKTADDIPYGGGGGMVMKIEPVALALESLCRNTGNIQAPRIVLTDPRGPKFDQAIARKWAQEDHIVLLCGHYEGVDDRIRQQLITDEISIGDYILTGGELPALVITDALTRLQPGALGDAAATLKDSFSESLLEYPHYTRPRNFREWSVPDILLCGHHAIIESWRRWHQLHSTRERRPDLFAKHILTNSDLKLLYAVEPKAPPEFLAKLNSDQSAADSKQGAVSGEDQTED